MSVIFLSVTLKTEVLMLEDSDEVLIVQQSNVALSS